MNKAWLSASILSAIAMTIRTWDGHIGPLAEARSSDLPLSAITFFHITWYFLSFLFLVGTVVFFRIATSRERTAAVAQANLLAVLFLGASAIVALNATLFGWFPAAIVAGSVTAAIGILALLGRRAAADRW